MKQTVYYLNNDSLSFPSPSEALTDPNGLLAIGGDLTPQRIVNAYQNGIFPWFNEGDPIMWWSPDPRAIIVCDEITINRTLRKFIKKSPYRVTLNKDFDNVIALCADAPFRKEGTWIIDDMITSYSRLHELGFAHSIEVWLDDELVGGLYGIAIGGYFSGESMFYQKANASKIALASLSRLLSSAGIYFIDCQITNDFLEDMGCIEINRDAFIQLKHTSISKTLPKDFWLPKDLALL